MFGGLGLGAGGGGSAGYLNDLWKYETTGINAGQWTWMKGSNTVNQFGTYGTIGTPAPGNAPGGRQNPVSWYDGAGNLWLFGGNGYPASVTNGYFLISRENYS